MPMHGQDPTKILRTSDEVSGNGLEGKRTRAHDYDVSLLVRGDCLQAGTDNGSGRASGIKYFSVVCVNNELILKGTAFSSCFA